MEDRSKYNIKDTLNDRSEYNNFIKDTSNDRSKYNIKDTLNRSEYNNFIKDALNEYGNSMGDAFIYSDSDWGDRDMSDNKKPKGASEHPCECGIVQPGGGGVGKLLLWAIFGR